MNELMFNVNWIVIVTGIALFYLGSLNIFFDMKLHYALISNIILYTGFVNLWYEFCGKVNTADIICFSTFSTADIIWFFIGLGWVLIMTILSWFRRESFRLLGIGQSRLEEFDKMIEYDLSPNLLTDKLSELQSEEKRKLIKLLEISRLLRFTVWIPLFLFVVSLYIVVHLMGNVPYVYIPHLIIAAGAFYNSYANVSSPISTFGWHKTKPTRINKIILYFTVSLTLLSPLLFTPLMSDGEALKLIFEWVGLPGLIITIILLVLLVFKKKTSHIQELYFKGIGLFMFGTVISYLSTLTILMILFGSLGFWIALGIISFVSILIFNANIRYFPNSEVKVLVWLILLAMLSAIGIEAYPRLQSKRLFRKAEQSILMGDFIDAQEHLSNSVEIMKYYKKFIPGFLPSLHSFDTRTDMAGISIANGNYSQAMEYVQEIDTGHGIYASKKLKLQTDLLKTEIYHALGDRAKENEAINNAWQIANRTLNRPYWTAHVNRYRARLEMEKGNYDEAIKIFKDVEQVGRRIGSYRLILSGVGGMGDTYFKQGKYPDAESFYAEALKLSQKYKAKGDEAQHLLKLAMSQKGLGKTDVASNNFSNAITLARQISAHEILWQGLYQMGQLLEAQGVIVKTIFIPKHRNKIS